MRKPKGGNLLRMDAAFTKSPAFTDMNAALRFIGCETYDQMLALPLADQLRFQREWTRLMQVRCDIDPNARPDEEAMRALGARRRAARDANAPPPVARPTDFSVGGRGAPSRSRALEARVVQLTRQGFSLATIARTTHTSDNTTGHYLRRYIGERVHAGDDIDTLAATFHRDRAWVEKCAVMHGPADPSEYAVMARERAETVTRLAAKGVRHRDIAARLGITRQRIGQILSTARQRAA